MQTWSHILKSPRTLLLWLYIPIRLWQGENTDPSISQITGLWHVMDRVSSPYIPSDTQPTSLQQNVFPWVHKPVGVIISCALITVQDFRQYLHTVVDLSSLKSSHNLYFRREKPAVLHNYVALAMGRRDFFLIPHDDYLIHWKMSSDILFISANVTQTCKEGDSAIRPYYLNCFVANA